jgi:hypothetical protein
VSKLHPGVIQDARYSDAKQLITLIGKQARAWKGTVVVSSPPFNYAAMVFVFTLRSVQVVYTPLTEVLDGERGHGPTPQ